MKILILSGGDPPSQSLLLDEVAWADYIIAVDHGYDMAADAEVPVDIILGDMDSITCEGLNLPLEKFPSHKDETDTELALIHAQKKSPQEIHILGGVGSRIDHSLGNIFLLEKFSPLNILLKDDNNEMFLMERGEYEISAKIFKYVSLIPVTEEVAFSTEGFLYEVENLTLKRANPRGISNELMGKSGKIHIHEGKAFLIQSKDKQ